MSEKIRKIYRKAGIAPPDGKGIHTQKFHEMAVAIKRDNPSYSMQRAYKIAMGQLGSEKAVNPSHRRGKKQTHHSAPMGEFWEKREKL